MLISESTPRNSCTSARLVLMSARISVASGAKSECLDFVCRAGRICSRDDSIFQFKKVLQAAG